MTSSRIQLTTPAFIIPLCIMLLNDLLLKETFHNFMTGILSDFMFLWVAPIFLCWLTRSRSAWIFVAVGTFFCWWNSSWSNGFFEVAASYGHAMNRIIDPLDFLAMPTLFLGYFYVLSQGIANVHPAQPFVVVLSILAFLADQPPSESRYLALDVSAVNGIYIDREGRFELHCEPIADSEEIIEDDEEIEDAGVVDSSIPVSMLEGVFSFNKRKSDDDLLKGYVSFDEGIFSRAELESIEWTCEGYFRFTDCEPGAGGRDDYDTFGERVSVLLEDHQFTLKDLNDVDSDEVEDLVRLTARVIAGRAGC